MTANEIFYMMRDDAPSGTTIRLRMFSFRAKEDDTYEESDSWTTAAAMNNDTKGLEGLANSVLSRAAAMRASYEHLADVPVTLDDRADALTFMLGTLRVATVEVFEPTTTKSKVEARPANVAFLASLMEDGPDAKTVQLIILHAVEDYCERVVQLGPEAVAMIEHAPVPATGWVAGCRHIKDQFAIHRI